MFERFTERARQVVMLARHEAAKHNHAFIGTEHLLWGLAGEDEGLASQVLTELALTDGIIDHDIREIVGLGPADASLTEYPFTPRAKKTLEMALREALSLGHNYIGTEHILLGLVRVIETGDGATAAAIFDRHHIVPAGVRDVVIEKLQGVRRAAENREAARIAATVRAARGQESVDQAEPAALSITDRLDRIERFLGIPEEFR